MDNRTLEEVRKNEDRLINQLQLYATVYGYTNVYDDNKNLLYRKLRCAFDDEYNEKRDMTPARELKIHKDKIGEYVIHNHRKYYID